MGLGFVVMRCRLRWTSMGKIDFMFYFHMLLFGIIVCGFWLLVCCWVIHEDFVFFFYVGWQCKCMSRRNDYLRSSTDYKLCESNLGLFCNLCLLGRCRFW